MSILEELKWRGLIADCTDAPELAKKISAPVTLYCGFDPTADSLHVGNLVPLLALRRFQLLGHHPIAVAGGATGSIGDPSGKTQERQLLTKEVLEHNIASVKQQLAAIRKDASIAQGRVRLQPAEAQARLVDNIAGGLGAVSAGPVGDGIVERSIAHFRAADPEFGERVAQGVKERRG